MDQTYPLLIHPFSNIYSHLVPSSVVLNIGIGSTLRGRMQKGFTSRHGVKGHKISGTTLTVICRHIRFIKNSPKCRVMLQCTFMITVVLPGRIVLWVSRLHALPSETPMHHACMLCPRQKRRRRRKYGPIHHGRVRRGQSVVSGAVYPLPVGVKVPVVHRS